MLVHIKFSNESANVLAFFLIFYLFNILTMEDGSDNRVENDNGEGGD